MIKYKVTCLTKNTRNIQFHCHYSGMITLNLVFYTFMQFSIM